MSRRPEAARATQVVLAVLAVLVTPGLSACDACGSKPAAPAVRADAATPPPASSSALTAPAPDAAAPDPCAALGAPRGGKSIGHTSVVFKLELEGGARAAWKPNARKVRGRYRGEVATYRLATALGIPNVPPACLSVLDRAAVTAALASNEAAARLFAEEAVVEADGVHGALIPWIPDLSFLPLERDPLRAEARGWLTAGRPVPPEKAELARQVSLLVLLDFVTGNWDRYSGENVGLDATGKTVLFIDNDAAFVEGPPAASVARNRALLEATDRFSRAVVSRARALDQAGLAAAIGDETPGRPLLPASVLAPALERLRELGRVVDAKVAAHGESETFAFR